MKLGDVQCIPLGEGWHLFYIKGFDNSYIHTLTKVGIDPGLVKTPDHIKKKAKFILSSLK